MWAHFDVWLLLAGLGIFLFGIRLIEDSIAKLGGRSFKRLVRVGTSTRAKAIFTGTAATAILQSSSAVTLMALAFVGAGLVSLQNGIGIVLGSNIGTTTTSWIVATLGFKLDISQIALPMIGIGGSMLIFLGSSVRFSQISHLLVGIGFLFLGLDQMKDSVSGFAAHVDPLMLVNARPWAFVVMGVVLTAIMQSSSAMMAILLTALYANIFDLREGAYAVIGTNIGTTFTIFLGAIGGNVVKKRLAWTHLLFNLFAGVLAVLGMDFYLLLIESTMGAGKDPMMALAWFHTLFNLVGVLLFLPLIGHFSVLMERFIPDKIEHRTVYITHTDARIPEAAVASVQKEVHRLLEETLIFHLISLDIDPRLVLPARRVENLNYQDRYQRLKELQAEIISFVTEVERHELTETESKELNKAIHSARLALYSAKSLKDVKANMESFQDGTDFLDRYHASLRKRVIGTNANLARFMEDATLKVTTVELAALLRKLEQDDQQGMIDLTTAARNGELKPIDLSTTFLVNRAIYRSGYDLVLAVAELILPQQEYHTLEKVLEVEESMGPLNAG